MSVSEIRSMTFKIIFGMSQYPTLEHLKHLFFSWRKVFLKSKFFLKNWMTLSKRFVKWFQQIYWTFHAFNSWINCHVAHNVCFSFVQVYGDLVIVVAIVIGYFRLHHESFGSCCFCEMLYSDSLDNVSLLYLFFLIFSLIVKFLRSHRN